MKKENKSKKPKYTVKNKNQTKNVKDVFTEEDFKKIKNWSYADDCKIVVEHPNYKIEPKAIKKFTEEILIPCGTFQLSWFMNGKDDTQGTASQFYKTKKDAIDSAKILEGECKLKQLTHQNIDPDENTFFWKSVKMNYKKFM
jgi:hypothetical protein